MSSKKCIKIAKILAGFAIVFSSIAANTRCYFIYHQPEMPDQLNKLKGTQFKWKD